MLSLLLFFVLVYSGNWSIYSRNRGAL